MEEVFAVPVRDIVEIVPGASTANTLEYERQILIGLDYEVNFIYKILFYIVIFNKWQSIFIVR